MSSFCTIEQGQLLGQMEKDVDGKPFISFLGIPYAKPPLGNLRFKDPQPPESWQGIRDATKEGNVCHGANIFVNDEHSVSKPIESEDCLYLNIFTHRTDLEESQLRPVMMFIHGGVFVTGSGSRIDYGPEFLITEDIVLVVINYRIGALGFLKIDDPALGVTGNAGIKDQVAALKWIQKNIKPFGGNPNNVTIFGHSAGAGSVHCLVLSPLAKNLFHKAILQSCSALCPTIWGINNALQLAQNCGFTGRDEDNEEILKFLQEISAEKLLEVQRKFGDWPLPTIKRAIGIAIEVKSESAVLTQDPINLMESGDYNHVPMMFGYTTLEGMMCLAETVKNSLNLLLNGPLVPHNCPMGQQPETSEKICMFYFGTKKIDLSQKIAVSKLITDAAILHSTYLSIKNHVRSCTEPIYFYRMSVETRLNLLKRKCQLTLKGVGHGDDLGYLFKAWDSPQIEPESLEEISMRRFVKLWTNFAKTGDPTPDDDNFLGIKWKPVTEDKLNFLDIGEDLVPGVDPDIESIKFWEEIAPQLSYK